MSGGVRIERDIIYGRGEGINLLVDLYLPNNPVRAVPIILYIHGRAWAGLDKRWCAYAMRLLEQDTAV